MQMYTFLEEKPVFLLTNVSVFHSICCIFSVCPSFSPLSAVSAFSARGVLLRDTPEVDLTDFYLVVPIRVIVSEGNIKKERLST